jgi:hypothetical protein
MIIVKLMGGLGNQMFQYALGRRLALLHGVPLKLDLSWFQTQSLRRYQLDCFQIAAEIASLQEISQVRRLGWGGFPGLLYRVVEPRLPLPLRRHIRERHPGFDPRILRAPRRVYLDGYWQSERYFKEIAALLRTEFTLRQPLSPQAQALLSAVQSGSSVSLHVRRGDYANSPHTNQVHGLLPPDYYRRAAVLIQERLPQAVFYIFSDEPGWASQNLAFLSPAVFVQLTSPDQDVEELLLMACCQHHIIANSSYSWWGAWLGENPAKIVVAPEKWFAAPDRMAKGLIPETWIHI